MKMPAGAQHIDKGIHRGLVRITRNKSPIAQAMIRKSRLDWRKISKRTINEKSINFSMNLAVLLSLEI